MIFLANVGEKTNPKVGYHVQDRIRVGNISPARKGKQCETLELLNGGNIHVDVCVVCVFECDYEVL